LFSSVFPGCKAISFGSRVSGLALSDSDLDIFLDTGNSSFATCKWPLTFV
jgi:predicted nucleotidyltransferase